MAFKRKQGSFPILAKREPGGMAPPPKIQPSMMAENTGPSNSSKYRGHPSVGGMEKKDFSMFGGDNVKMKMSPEKSKVEPANREPMRPFGGKKKV